jgi:membrane-associated phospholipid phosphatase
MKSFKFDKIESLLIFVVVLWILLAIIFAFTDLLISTAISDQDSLLGIFGRDFGESPGYGLVVISLSCLVGSYIKDINKQRIPGLILLSGSLVYFFIGLLIKEKNLIADGSITSVLLVLFLLITNKRDFRNYRKLSQVILLLLLINPILFVQTFKIFWGRVRFYNLASDFSNFTSWFIPRGITGGKSFPSGHAAMGAMFFPLLIKLKTLEWKRSIKVIGTFIIVAWALFVGISRVLIGAHYASDVLFSIGVASISTIILYKRFYKT